MDARATEFSVAEAKARFSELLARAEAGEEITIRRHGHPVARLTRVERKMTPEEKRKSWDEWFAYRKARNIRLGPGETIKDFINEGRR